MGKSVNQILFALFLGIGIPLIVFRFFSTLQQNDKQIVVFSAPTATELIPDSTQQSVNDICILMNNGETQQMSIEEYITGVLLGEMPAEFETEALKAQAVAARTYAYKRMYPSGKHEEADVCTDPGCCQAYCDEAQYLTTGGTVASANKVRNCVKSTEKQVLTYNGELIEATYFSCSGGRTEDALAVWGSDLPYLQSVDSPGEENADHHIDTVSFAVDEFLQLLGLPAQQQRGIQIGNVTYTNGGGVSTIEICRTVFDGVTVRERLGLRSTAFVITPVGRTVTVTTKGFGHRVGLSQYGAEAMAVAGANYKDILSHYYSGASIELWPYN